MSVKNQKNRTSNSLAKASIEESNKQVDKGEETKLVKSQENQIKDPLVAIAIEEGSKQVNDAEPETEIALKSTASQRTMIEKLTSALTLSAKVIVESAINYVHFYVKDSDTSIKQLEEYSISVKQLKEDSNSLGLHPFKLTLAAETSHNLEELGMKEQPNECAVTGIQLLYGRLLNSKLKNEMNE